MVDITPTRYRRIAACSSSARWPREQMAERGLNGRKIAKLAGQLLAVSRNVLSMKPLHAWNTREYLTLVSKWGEKWVSSVAEVGGKMDGQDDSYGTLDGDAF